jgi:selenocysteine-specific elongation factor
VRFHSGTSEILARVVLLDRDVLEPGENTYAQLRLESPTVVIHGDPFVIRSYSPTQTIGGGIVLDGLPEKHRRHNPGVMEHVRRLHDEDPSAVARGMIEASGLGGMSRKDLDRRLNLTEERWNEIAVDARFRESVVTIEGGLGARSREEDALYVSRGAHQSLRQEVLEQLKAFGRESPLEAGLPREDLRGRCPSHPLARVFSQALQDLLGQGDVVVEGDRWRWRDHRADLGREQSEKLSAMEKIFLSTGLQPPLQKEVEDQLGLSERGARELLDLLVRQGKLIKVKDGLYFHKEGIQTLQARLVALLKDKGEMQPVDFKEMTQLSRKFMIPLLEYFDRMKVTMRVGDKRVLREKGQG